MDLRSSAQGHVQGGTGDHPPGQGSPPGGPPAQPDNHTSNSARSLRAHHTGNRWDLHQKPRYSAGPPKCPLELHSRRLAWRGSFEFFLLYESSEGPQQTLLPMVRPLFRQVRLVWKSAFEKKHIVTGNRCFSHPVHRQNVAPPCHFVGREICFGMGLPFS